MSAPSISLCMIVRNVEKTIQKCLASIVPFVDEVIITDTGSDDDTKNVIRRACPRALLLDFNPSTHPEAFLLDIEDTWTENKVPGPFSGRTMLADFGSARQHGWSLAKSDYVMWIDSDDVLENGSNLRQIVEEMRKHGLDTALLNYDYASDPRGNVICKLTRERIVRRTLGATWKQPIHEVLTPLGVGRFFDQCNVRHLRHELGIEPHVHHRNLKVLSKWLSANKDKQNLDPRMLFYLGMEERFIWPERAIEHFAQYCEISGWDEERGIAHMLSGTVHEHKERYDQAFAQYAQAALEAHWNPDPFFGAARIAYFKRDWEKCIEWTERGLELANKNVGRQSLLMYDPMDRVYRPYIYYSAALVEVGRMKDVIEASNKGLKYNPSDPHLIGNKEVAEKYLSGQIKGAETMSGNLTLRMRAEEPLESPPQEIPTDILAAFSIEMWKQNTSQGLHVRALQLIDSLPESVSFHPRIRKARDFTISKLEKTPENPAEKSPRIEVRKNLKIAIWTGPGWEPWSPKSLDTTGLGGSETAAICMAQELLKLGHSVKVYSDCASEAGQHDGVEYIQYQRAMEKPEIIDCDILIVSRQAAILQLPFKYKACFVWVHDIHLGELNGEMGRWLLKPDRFFCLSEWHKEFFLQTYPFIHQDNIIVTKNGLDLRYFQAEPKKDGNRLIYSSSPDRGLERLLQLYPRIREQVPDVQLDVYYGFHTWRSMAEASGNHEQLQKIAYFERILAEQKNAGVTYHGRVNKETLAKAFLRSKVWAYPTWFTETYCLTAIEAQAAGCVPVTSALAALPETVSHGFVIQQAPSSSEQYARIFVNRVVKLLRDEEERSKYASAGREYAFQYHGWDKVAKKWEAHFKEILKEKSETTISVPRFGGA